MGSISAFGTGCAALISVLAVSPARADPGVTLGFDLAGLRSAKGNILICLTRNPKAFPDCGKDPAAIKLRVAAAQANSISVPGIAPGRWAAALVHDENGNDKMDMALFLPREGFGFSRNPKIGMGPPKFASAAFDVGAQNLRLAMRVKYMM